MTEMPAGDPDVGAPEPAIRHRRAGRSAPILDPRGWRTTRTVAAVMLSTVLGVNLVNAAVPLPADPGSANPRVHLPVGPAPDPGQPSPADPGPVDRGNGVDVSGGVAIFPPDGWTVVASESGQVVLQKAAVLMIVIGTPWPDSPLDLAVTYRDAFFEAGQLTGSEPDTGVIGGRIPAAVVSYAGILDGTSVDGVIVAGVSGSTGVVLNAFAATGGLVGVGDDIDTILATIWVSDGPG